jgi:hypothetical protein
MSSPNYDDPAVEEAWCNVRRAEVAAYLEREGVIHGRIGDGLLGMSHRMSPSGQ